jgi:hypothetical protein
MTPEYESLKAEITEYAKQREIFHSERMWLESIYNDIMRKQKSLARRALQFMVQGLQKPITLCMGKLPYQRDFFQDKKDTPLALHDHVNRAFATQEPTLHHIETALVTALKEGKSRLQMGYTSNVHAPCRDSRDSIRIQTQT